MKSLLLLIAATAAGAAESSPPPAAERDPFAPAQTGSPAEEAPVIAPTAAPAPAAPVIRVPLLEGVARSGATAIAVFNQGARRVIVAVGGDFSFDQEAWNFVSCDGEDVLLRHRSGREVRLQIVTPVNPNASLPIESPVVDTPPVGADGR